MEFNKYKTKGAYHWTDISAHPFRSNPFVRARYKSCLKLISQSITPNKNIKILDLGCGDGALSYLMWRAGYTVIGIDTSLLGIDLACAEHKKRYTNCEFRCGEVGDVESNSFDGVICSDVIEHVQRPGELIDEIYRVLKPNGVAVLSTPIRITEAPLDVEHMAEWWPGEWRSMFKNYDNVEFYESHPVAMMELLNVRFINVGVKIFSIFIDLFSKRTFWNIYALQYAVLKK